MRSPITFTWWGHACIQLETPAGRSVLVDPWFGNPKSPKTSAGVDRCDLLLVTHGHSDHLGEAVEIARRTKPVWPAIHELSLWLDHELPGAGVEIIGMNKGGAVTVDDLRVTMVRADHSAGDWSSSRAAPIYLGEPCGFVVEQEDGTRIYFAGDTDLFSDMRLIAELHRPTIGFLPIGGHFTMDPQGAAYAAELLGLEVVVPIHYGTFPLLAGTPDELRAALRARGLDRVTVLSPEPGDHIVAG